MKEVSRFPSESQGSDEIQIDSFGLKELFTMSEDEEVADIEAILRVVDEVLLEPIPDLSDPIAVEEFNAKLIAVQNWAETQRDRVDVLLIRQRAGERLIET